MDANVFRTHVRTVSVLRLWQPRRNAGKLISVLQSIFKFMEFYVKIP